MDVPAAAEAACWLTSALDRANRRASEFGVLLDPAPKQAASDPQVATSLGVLCSCEVRATASHLAAE